MVLLGKELGWVVITITNNNTPKLHNDVILNWPRVSIHILNRIESNYKTVLPVC